MRKNSRSASKTHPRAHRVTRSPLAIAAAAVLGAAIAPSARAETPSSASSAAQYLTLGTSAAYAVQESSTGSALEQITRAQNDSAPLPSPPNAQPLLASASAAIFQQGSLGPEAHLQPAVLTAPPSLGRAPVGPDPSVFGSIALSVSQTGLDGRWTRVQRAPPPTDARWKQMVRTAAELPARERLARVNTWLNHAIAFQSDLQNYGVSDYWASPRETLARGRGDCEDYAIAKMELLRESGIPAADLYLVIAKDLVRRVDHAVLLVRLKDDFWVLDSGADEVLAAEHVADYRPVVTFSAAGREWMHGYRRAPELLLASASDLAPASGH